MQVRWMQVKFGKDAGQACDCSVAKNTTLLHGPPRSFLSQRTLIQDDTLWMLRPSSAMPDWVGPTD